MTRVYSRESMKWLTLAAVIFALWGGILAVPEARAAIAVGPGLDAIQREHAPSQVQSENIRPVWVIVVYELRNEKLIGITEFVFESYEECWQSSTEVKEKLGLHLNPVCYLRWLKGGEVSDGNVM